MSEILNKRIVLVLNRNWQAINMTTPATAFFQMATDVATYIKTFECGCKLVMQRFRFLECTTRKLNKTTTV